MQKYFVLNQKLDSDCCSVDDFPDDMPDIHCPAAGIEMGDSYPAGLKFKMSVDSPGLVVPDLIQNALGYQMISEKLKLLLDTNAKVKIEYLPFVLVNHKKRIVKGNFYLANIIGTIDCVDREKTKGDPDPVNKGQYMFIQQLVLLSDRIGPDINIFRIDARPKIVIVREDLKQILEQAQVSGCEFLEVGGKVKLW